eukprot:976644-Pelagomonas_calceolata.AAC.2
MARFVDYLLRLAAERYQVLAQWPDFSTAGWPQIGKPTAWSACVIRMVLFPAEREKQNMTKEVSAQEGDLAYTCSQLECNMQTTTACESL